MPRSRLRDLRFPDLAPTRRLLLVAVAVTLVVSVFLLVRDWHDLPLAYGDTDDATRLTLVRGLLDGQGWWNPRIARYQPPEGVWMHWSRLLDGGLAAMIAALRLVLSPARAELMTRAIWPLLWLVPATAATLLAARRLAGRGPRGFALRGPTVLAAAIGVLVAANALTVQFHPGRIDHHDVQITFALIVLAGAMASGVRGAAVAGLATGIGLAVGLEALAFEAVLAASLGLRVLLDPRQAGRATAFGLTLAGSTAAAFLIQTPPSRWGVPACDALGANLAVGAVLAGLGLAGAAWATRGRDWRWRLAALALAGAVALAVYLAMDPRCTKGIFADVDPAIRPFWLDHVNEVKTWPRVWRDDRAVALTVAVTSALGLASWAALGLVPARRRDPAWWTLGGALALGVAAACTAVRMSGYLEWFAVAPLAAAAAELGARAPRWRMPATAVLAALLAPPLTSELALLATGSLKLNLGGAATPLNLALAVGAIAVLASAVLALRARRLGMRGAVGLAALLVPLVGVIALLANGQRLAQAHPRPAPDPADHCFDRFAYTPLARLPRGLTVSEIDLGPFVVADTPSATESAPYHRMSLGIMRARRVMTAPVDAGPAQALALSPGGTLGPVYVLECRRHANHIDRVRIRPDSLQARLDAGKPPTWLQRLAPGAKSPIEIYRVLPAPPTGAAPTRAAKASKAGEAASHT